MTLKKIINVFKNLREDPFAHKLVTHQVNLPKYGKVYASRVTGDIRIIWMFDKDQSMVIIALKVGGHDKVY